MTPEFYRLVHVGCALLLFLALGGALLGPADAKPPKLAMILHGLALVLMAVAGVGYVHKSASVDWGNWLYAKIGCWLFIGVLPVLIRKRVLARPLALLLGIAAGVTAVWLAQQKPF